MSSPLRVLVTGATSGIGHAVARAFSEQGARVVGTGRDQTRLGELAGHVELAMTLDVTKQHSVDTATQAAMARLGGLDVLVNCAGIGAFGSVQDCPEDELLRLLQVNLVGVSRVTRAVLPTLVAQDSGVIVQVGSVAGHRGLPNQAAYCATKHALVGWSEALRAELQGTGVHVVRVAPPAVDTPFFENAGAPSFRADHPDLTLLSAESVAASVVQAAAERPREVVLTARARVLRAADRVAPDVVGRLRSWRRGS